MFNDELLFEQALIKLLIDNGWEKEIIKYPTEKELLTSSAKEGKTWQLFTPTKKTAKLFL
mgnify:CR=1 FL=1